MILLKFQPSRKSCEG